MSKAAMHLWTVYFNPSDYPGRYVAREFVVDNDGARSMPAVIVGETLEAVRALLPPGLYPMGRQKDDEAQIVEVWI